MSICSKISRDKIYKKIYDVDSRNSIDNVLVNEKNTEEFYAPLVELLTLICTDSRGGE